MDSGAGGAKAPRPALDGLLQAVRRRAVDVIVCTKLDRLARSLEHLVPFGAELKTLCVDLVVLR